jgi:tetratricopeptide (TPR) repeat protein
VSFVLLVSFVWRGESAGAIPEQCRDGELSVVTAIRELMARGDNTRARQAAESVPIDNACPALMFTKLAVAGWFEARALAPAGGAAERMGPVRHALAELERYRSAAGAEASPGTVTALEIEYAQTLIRAAIAAAQDERPEMELLLGHALDLVQRLEQRGAQAAWPRPFNLASGELWFEVDRYEEARTAFERAVQADASSAALVGLARAQARLGRVEQGCATLRRARDAAIELRARAAADLPRCR